MSLAVVEQAVTSGTAELKVSGRLTLAEAPEVKERVRSLIDRGVSHIIMDLSGLEFVDSSGLAVFVSTLKATRQAGGWLRLFGIQERPREIFTLTRLDQVFELRETREECLA